MKKTMKKLFAAAAVIAVLTTSTASVFAEYDPNRPIDPSQGIMATKSAEGTNVVNVNGKKLEGAETYVSESGEVMVPIRAVAEELGFEVGWDAGRVTLTNLPVYVTFAIGVDGYTFAKTAPMQIGKAPELTEEKTYVPATFFSEILQADIKTNLGGTTIVYGEKQDENKDGENKDDGETAQTSAGTAVVKSVEKDEKTGVVYVMVEDEKNGEIQLNIGADTEILKGEEKIAATDLEEGMKLSIEYGAAMTMSLPPQNNPVKITIAE